MAKTVESKKIKKMAEQIVGNCDAGIADRRGGFITHGIQNHPGHWMCRYSR